MRFLCKHLDEELMFVDLDDVSVDAECVIEMKGKGRADLAQYIIQTYQEDWVVHTLCLRAYPDCICLLVVLQIRVLHHFVGVSAVNTDFDKSTPGVYQIVWYGGVRARNSPQMNDIETRNQEDDIAPCDAQYPITRFACDSNEVCAP